MTEENYESYEIRPTTAYEKQAIKIMLKYKQDCYLKRLKKLDLEDDETKIMTITELTKQLHELKKENEKLKNIIIKDIQRINKILSERKEVTKS